MVPAVPDGLLDDGAEALLARRQVRLHQHDQLHHEVQLAKSRKDQDVDRVSLIGLVNLDTAL